MATNNQATWEDMRSKLMSMGGVGSCDVGEPRSPPESGHVAIIPDGGEIDETTLQHPREIHRVTLRRYQDWLAEPISNIEYVLDSWRAEIMEDIFGDFDLGGTIAYPLPDQFGWEYGLQSIGSQNRMFRILDLLVAYRIDDRAAMSA